MESAEDPTVFWEAAAVGIAYKKLLLGMLQAVLRAGGKSSSAFMVCMNS